MVNVRRLIREADPLTRRDDGRGLSVRATEHLAGLLGSAAEVDAPVGVGAEDRRGRSPTRRRSFVLAAAGVLALAGGATAIGLRLSQPEPPAANQPVYPDTVTLEGHADAIVRGVIESARDEKREGNLETAAQVRLSRVAKGKSGTGSVIAVNYTSLAAGTPEAPTGLRVGGEYVLLIEWSPDGRAYLVNSIQGYYAIQQGRAVATDDNPVVLSPRVRDALGLE